jgi:3-dehydroquinate synthetase
VVKALQEGGKLQVDTVILPDGEEHKSLEVVSKVQLPTTHSLSVSNACSVLAH